MKQGIGSCCFGIKEQHLEGTGVDLSLKYENLQVGLGSQILGGMPLYCSNQMRQTLINKLSNRPS